MSDDGDPSSDSVFSVLDSAQPYNGPSPTDESCLGTNPEGSGSGPDTPTDAQTGMEPQSNSDPILTNAEAPITLTSSVPPPKRYAHHGKRRRSYTEEMFRCQHVDKISRSDLVCNSLLWRNRPQALREHLLEHLTVDQVEKMTDDEVIKWYSEAKRIFLQGIPEDCDEEDEDNTEDE